MSVVAFDSFSYRRPFECATTIDLPLSSSQKEYPYVNIVITFQSIIDIP
jgi:hypothetical protein